MAITKIHPIKATLALAIRYITKPEKTDEKLLVSCHKCYAESAAQMFMKTRDSAGGRGKVLARHLIQSFLPGETTPEKAHEIGLALCDKVLKNAYEFVLATHVDKGHIHNHVIFNNVSSVTGKCYHSNKRSYHQIRYQSDKLCKENQLVVIDEAYESYRRKFKNKGRSWYENEQRKRGTSWKSRLQFDIDRFLEQAQDWKQFLSLMETAGYEIKQGKHLAFRHKEQQRFTRTKTIGSDYLEERLKERLDEVHRKPPFKVKKAVGKLIDLSQNKKAQNSKAYAHWAIKHNLKTKAESIVTLRQQGILSARQLDETIQLLAEERQGFQDEIKALEQKLDLLASDMENLHVIRQYREVFRYYQKHPEDKSFAQEYVSELALYKAAVKARKGRPSSLPDTQGILSEMESLEAKRDTVMGSYEENKVKFQELVQLRRNYGEEREKDGRLR